MTKLPIAFALLSSVLLASGVARAQPGPGDARVPPGGGPPFLPDQFHAITTSGEDRGVVAYFERFFPLTNLSSPATVNVPVYAVKETNASASYLMMRILATGTPIPCPLYYSSPDCTGEPVGVPFTSAVGLACEGIDGNVWTADPTAEITSSAVGSIWAPRWSGLDVTAVCFVQGGMVPTVAVRSLGSLPLPDFRGRVTLAAE